MTNEDRARVKWACAWVRATAGLLPHLRAFLTVRLARHDETVLAVKVARMNGAQIFRLWEDIKNEQCASQERKLPVFPSGRIRS